jgi:hypothetical protein
MTIRERIYVVFAFIASGLAGDGAMRVACLLVDPSSGLFVALIVGIGTLSLALMGVEHIRRRRIEETGKPLGADGAIADMLRF